MPSWFAVCELVRAVGVVKWLKTNVVVVVIIVVVVDVVW